MVTPLPADAITSAGTQLIELHADGEHLWCVELDAHQGRFLLLRDGVDVTPEGRSASSQVYEYGGCALHVRDDTAWFVDTATQDVVVLTADGRSRQVTRAPTLRFADLWLDRERDRLLAVCEDLGSAGEPTASLVAIALSDGAVSPLVVGHDFVTNPRVSPDGTRLAYVRWQHPHLPWDTAELVLAELDPAGSVVSERVVAGGGDTSAGGPVWTPDGTLLFLWDDEGWWNVHRVVGDGTQVVHRAAAYTGGPGLNHPDLSTDGRVVLLAAHAEGRSRLLTVDLESGERHEIPSPATYFKHPRLLPDGFAYLAGSATDLVGLWRQRPGSEPERLRSTGSLDEGVLTEPDVLEVPTRDGGTVLARVWRPLPAAGPPWPTLVHVHGGPVLTSSSAVSLGIYAPLVPAFWTTRGYAYVDVDYRGTIGYGRDNWRHLYGRWGQVDVTDAEDVARHLIATGTTDPERVAIRGASAGGWTTTHAMTQGTCFRAGTAYFPITDLVAFARTTHKLESHYVESLVGPYDEQVYLGRSPLTHAAAATGPVLLIQGSADRVCPPAQSYAFAEAVREAGGRAEVVLIEGEGHGFVRATSNNRALEAEAAFYEEVFGV